MSDPSRLIGVAARIPEALESLAGPDSGRVTLPVRPAVFGVSDPAAR